MRNHGFVLSIGIVFLALGCLTLGGCADPMGEPPPEGNTGIVRVRAGNDGRTLMPSLPSVNGYRFSFVSLEESPQRNPVVRESVNASLELELTAGAWDLTVTALTGTGSGAKEIARGSARVLVLGGITSSVTVQLGNEPGDEPGTLGYTVAFPATVTRASLTLASMGGGEDSAPVDLWAGSTESGGVRTKTGVLNAAAGNYLLNIELYGAAGNGGKTEAVHIYSNTETPAAYTFSAGDFSPTTAYQTGSGQSLYDVLTTIKTTSGADFTILLGQDETAFASFTLDTASFTGKKVRILGGGHTVTLSGTGSLFTLETGAVLVLRDIELYGRGDNISALITVAGGDLLMNPGTVITGNGSSANFGGHGGVYVDTGTFTMNGGIISGNSTLYGGGVCLHTGTFAMGGGSILGNSSTVGGGVYAGNGTFTMSGGSISENSVSPAHSLMTIGGGVYVGSNATFTMSGGTISGNSAIGDNGGGGVYSVGSFAMSGGTISGNNSSDWGGGVRNNGTFTMSGGFITGNSSSNDGDGVENGGTFTMDGGTISDNSGGGGGVRNNGTFTMSGGIISGNSGHGGVNNTYGAFTMSGGTITGNSSTGIGGGVRNTNGTFTMSGGTISGNTPSSLFGGGVYVNYGTFTMSNNARIDPSNEVYLGYYYDSGIYSYRYAAITIAGDFTGSDTIAVIDLSGAAADWLGRTVLGKDAGYTGTIPIGRFSLGNFVSNGTKTPIAYIIDSAGRLMNQ